MVEIADETSHRTQGHPDGRGSSYHLLLFARLFQKLKLSASALSLSLSLSQDAKKAYDAGCDAIYLSNHGARALDGYVLSFHLHIACPLL